MKQKKTISGLVPGIVMMLVPALAPAEAVKVTTVDYESVAFYPDHSTAAEVIALHHSKVAAEISANVLDVVHDTGEKVTSGDTIISLDCRSYELQLKQAGAAHEAAMAMYTNASKLLDSAKKLRKNNNVSEELYNQREADEARLKAEKNRTWAGIKTAELAVERCAIKAPYDGYISERFISKGELAMPGTPVFEIVIADAKVIQAEISSSEYDSFTHGNAFSYRYQGRDYPVEVRHILPMIDPQFRAQSFHPVDLVFVMAKHQKLPVNERCLNPRFTPFSDQKLKVFDNGGKVAADPIA